VITIEHLHEIGLDWLFDQSFLGKLAPEDQAAVLAGAELRDVDEGEVLIETGQQGRDVHLVVAGQAVVTTGEGPATQTVARVGPGRLLGERALRRHESTRARVKAISPMRTLSIPGPHFVAMLGRIPALARYVDDLIELRDRSPLLLNLLLRDPILRSLGREGLERLLQSGAIVRYAAHERIVTAGERGSDVFLLVKGRVAVYAPAPGGGRERVTTNGPGWFFGHASLLLDVPRTADIEALEACELLQVGDRAFMALIARNPPLYRRLYESLVRLDLHADEAMSRSRGPMVVALWAARPDIGTTTLTYGVAAALAKEGPVTVVDLDGERSAQRLGMAVRTGRVGAFPVRRLQGPPEWDLSVLWPRDRADTAEVIRALKARSNEGSSIVIGLSDAHPPDAETIRASETIVYLRWARDVSAGLSIDHLGFHVDAVRLEDDVELPMAASRNAVRIPHDPVTGPRFWRSGDPDVLRDPSSPLGRAAARLVRVLRGRTVGVALGGGGALGYAHVALLRALHEAKVPIDYLAGVSFGSMVGAAYAAGGLELCDELIRRRGQIRWLLGTAPFTLHPMAWWLQRLTHGKTLGTTEIPFFPVSLDVLTGEEVVITRGTVAEGMRASSSFPGLFPAMRRGVARLVDGGIINNVPASVVWDAGANFIIASNIVPPHPVGRAPSLSDDLLARVRGMTVARLDDMLRSVFLLMSQTGRDRATLADYVFNLDVQGYNVYDFHRGDEIYRLGLEQARAALPDIVYQRDSDRSIRLGQR
jgi:predicted acylesterase/phospholipase RssA/CRP-like cAMP-binding protein